MDGRWCECECCSRTVQEQFANRALFANTGARGLEGELNANEHEHEHVH